MSPICRGFITSLKKHKNKALTGLVAIIGLIAVILTTQEAKKSLWDVKIKLKNLINRLVPESLSKYSNDFTPLFVDAAKLDPRFKKYADNELLLKTDKNAKVVYWDHNVLINLAKFVRGGGSDAELADLLFKEMEENYRTGGIPLFY